MSPTIKSDVSHFDLSLTSMYRGLISDFTQEALEVSRQQIIRSKSEGKEGSTLDSESPTEKVTTFQPKLKRGKSEAHVCLREE